MRQFVDFLFFRLGEEDFLCMIKSIVSGTKIAYRYSQNKVGRSLKAEQLKTDQQGGKRTVRNAAKNTCHTEGCRKSGIQREKALHSITESCPDKKRRDDFSALKTSA